MLDLISFSPILILTLTLSILQTIAGIGILVLGTPILLLLDLRMIEIMTILLPLSILNSLINIFYLKNRFSKISIDLKIKIYFFFIWFPGIFLGLFALKFFSNYINFNLLVSLTIWFFLAASYINLKKKIKISDLLKKNFIFIIGIIHGVTNSGGSLLSMLIVDTYKENLINIRYKIIFFYFFLALFQYLSILLIFDLNPFTGLKFSFILCLIIGIIIGNILSKKINLSQLRNVILGLAFISSIFLISQS